jgi:general secretion pathway protein H
MKTAPDQRRGRDAGFALVEVTLALLLIGLLATLALPGLVRATGPAALRVAAFQVSALLREDRNAALRSGRVTVAGVEADGRRVRSLTSSTFVSVPAGATAGLLDAPGGIRFYGDGRASGGQIVLASSSSRVVVTVSPDTGAIHVVSP